MRSLVRGQKSKLSDFTTATLIQVGLGITASEGMVFDLSCFGVDAEDRLSDDRYFIFYNQKSSPCGSLASLGRQGGDMERFQINLSTLPQTIRKLVFTITLDGEVNMSQISRGYLQILDRQTKVAEFSFNGADFHAEKAIIVGEIYLKDVWRFAAVGQGFNGGLSALLNNFGGEEIKPSPPASPKVSLEKKLEKDAPHLVSLAKQLTVSLEKKKLQDVIAKVALVLDASGSMSSQYSRGDVQLVVNKVVPIAVHFDDDGELDTWAFANKSQSLTPVTVKNINGYVNREWGGWQQWMAKLESGYNNEPVVMNEIVKTYMRSNLPAYVIFISDGGVGYSEQIAKIITESSKYPIFWQFVGVGLWTTLTVFRMGNYMKSSLTNFLIG